MMKRIPLFLLFWVTCTICMGQDRHFTFKGIPLCGSLNRFSEKLIEAGYEPNNHYNLMYHGSYNNYHDCCIHILHLKNYDKVFGVTVQLPMVYSWEKLSDQYKRMKKRLRREFGEPKTSKEEFDKPDLKSNAEKYQEVLQGRFKYLCTFDNGIGIVCLQIDKISPFETCGVLLSFIDKASLKASSEDGDFARTLGDHLNRVIK